MCRAGLSWRPKSMAGRSEMKRNWEYQLCAGSRRAPAIILHGDEAKGFVCVEHSRYAAVAEPRQYVVVSLHFRHSGSSDTEYRQACQDASRLIVKGKGENAETGVPWNGQQCGIRVAMRVCDWGVGPDAERSAHATDVSRNEYAGKLDKGLMWCADPDRPAKHMAETATNSGNFGKPTTRASGTLQAEGSETHRGSQAAGHDQEAAQGPGCGSRRSAGSKG